MPNVLPNIPQEPAQGIQALLDTVYLWNPDVANGLIDKVNELLEELGDLTNLGAIKPYAELVAPVPQYLPMSYNNAIYVANEALDVLPATPDLTKWTQIATKVDQGAIETQIQAEEDARIAEDAILQGNIDSEASARAQADTALSNRITAEETARSGADSNLQTQIDAISASSDVKDIVGTHAELEQYDTSTLGDNDIIKVLQDETEEGATTYYRWVEADQEFSLIGEEGPYYTKEQTNTLLGQKQNTLTAGEGITIENDVISATATGDFVPQLDVLPTADASNVGEIAQYSGETIPDVPATAVATQTVGSGLSDLAVNVDKFVEAEQPTQGGNTSFVADVVPDTSVVVEATIRPEDYSFDSNAFVTMVKATWTSEESQDQFGFGTKYLVFNGAEQGEQSWGLCLGSDGSGQVAFIGDNPSSWGLTVINQPSSYQYIMLNTTRGSVVWSKNGTTVNLTNYGITYSGTPANGDTISVAYTPFVAGITNGYFYTNQPTYTDPNATISQTAGQVDSMSFETTTGNTEISGTAQNFRNLLAIYNLAWPLTSGEAVFTFASGNWSVGVTDDSGFSSSLGALTGALIEAGFSVDGEPTDGDTIICSYTFGLTDLSVDVDTFVEAEQPTQSGNTSFVASVTPENIAPLDGTVQSGVEVTIDPVVFLQKEHTFNPTSSTRVYQRFTIEYQDPSVVNVQILWSDGTTSSDGVTASDDALALWGITLSGALQPGDAFSTSYTAPIITWSKNGTTVDLAEYGISYSGTPVNGDTLTVAYTAPVIAGYAWNQINVQPGSDGGNAGIEWKTKVDLPAEYTGSVWDARPYYTVVGGLPDGTYEFYFATKVKRDLSFPVGEVIYKVRFTKNSQNNTARGIMGYVFDGDYMNNDSKVYGGEARWWYNWLRDNGSDLIIYGDLMGSDILNYNEHQTVPECFKLSAIKNMDTDQEYIADGAINLDGSEPAYTALYDSNMVLAALANPPYIPQDATWTAWAAAEFATKTVYINTRIMGGTLHLITDGSELIINLGGVGGSEIVPYSQEIVRATGIFAGCYLAYSTGYTYVMGVDTTTAATLSGTVRCACGGSSPDTVSMWFDTIPTEPLTTLAQFGPQAYRLGTITYDGLGNIVQYTGETNANYTNGYFYKATGTVVSVPASISFINVNPNDVTVTVANPDALVTALNNIGGWGEEWVRNRLMFDYTEFRIDYDFDTGTIVRVWWGNYGDIYNQDVFNCFAVSTTGSYAGEVSVSFACNRGYVPESKGVQNAAWVQVEVQPNSGGLPDQTGNAGKFLTTDGTDASWSDKPLVNRSTNGFAVGDGSSASSWGSLAIGDSSECSGLGSVAIGTYGLGSNTKVTAIRAVQIGWGTNSDANTFKVSNTNGNYEIMSADGTIPADRLTHAINKYSTMPTASASNEGWIVQFTGTTDNTYTHGHLYECVSDGQDPATYSWEEVSFGGGSSYTAGTGISIDANNEISVTAPTLVNTSNTTGNIAPLGILGTVGTQKNIAIGSSSQATSTASLAIGTRARATAAYAIQIGMSSTAGANVNNDPNTFKVCNDNGNFEIMSADGTIPEARLADTTNAAQGQVLTLDSNLNAVWQASSGGGLPSQTGNSGKFLTTDGTDASWSDKPLINKATFWSSVAVANSATYGAESTSAIDAVAIGCFALANASGAVAIGPGARVTAAHGIQIACYDRGAYRTNNKPNTFCVGNQNGNYELMSADGTVPTARLTKVNTTVTLAVADWSSNTQTVSVTGMTANGVVLVSPTPANQSAYTDAGILCTAQAAGSLTFTCDTVPSADIIVTVVML